MPVDLECAPAHAVARMREKTEIAAGTGAFRGARDT
jgi:hypothetical protein